MSIDGLTSNCKDCRYELIYKKSLEQKIKRAKPRELGKNRLRDKYCINCIREKDEKCWGFCRNCEIILIQEFIEEKKIYHNEYMKEYRKTYPKLCRQQNLQNLKRFRKRHPEKYLTYREDDNNRLTKKAYKILFDKFNWECFNCGTRRDLYIDHYIPYSKGGRFVAGNLSILCRSCNSIKNNSDPIEFYNKESISLLKTMLKEQNSYIEFEESEYA